MERVCRYCTYVRLCGNIHVCVCVCFALIWKFQQTLIFRQWWSSNLQKRWYPHYYLKLNFPVSRCKSHTPQVIFIDIQTQLTFSTCSLRFPPCKIFFFISQISNESWISAFISTNLETLPQPTFTWILECVSSYMLVETITFV